MCDGPYIHVPFSGRVCLQGSGYMNSHSEMFAMLVETSHRVKFDVWSAVRGTRILHKFTLISYTYLDTNFVTAL
jgi:hypothetical protein